MDDVLHRNESAAILGTKCPDKSEVYDIRTLKLSDQKRGRGSGRDLAYAAFCEKNVLSRISITTKLYPGHDLRIKKLAELVEKGDVL